MNGRFRRFLRAFALFGLLGCRGTLRAQQTTSQAAPVAAPDITEAWNGLLQGAIPQQAADPALTVQQLPVENGHAADFRDHFFLETRTEFRREQTDFTGNPTVTGVINAPVTGIFNPNGVPDPSVFQPSSNVLYSFLNWGTRGWLSDRVNTDFSFRYEQDLTQVNLGAPVQGFLNTFHGNRRLELLTGYVAIEGRPTDGAFAGATLELGRQYVYGAELAAMDGASFNMNRRRYSYTLFAGRRFSYFADPDQRAVGGGNFVWRPGGETSLEYDALFYVKGTHTFTLRHRFGPAWLFSTYFRMIGSAPVDYAANGIWAPANGKTTVRLSFFQKLTNNDYFYDYTFNARDRDPYNRLLRLYLGPFAPYTQLVVDARRTVTRRLWLGGSLWIRRLDDYKDQGPFDTSFQDYRADAQIYPGRRFETFLEYHERDSDRLAPFPSFTFDDVSAAGETKIQDFTAEIGRTFGEGRLRLKFGGFYRRMNFQDRFFYIDHIHDRGLLGSGSVKVDDHTRVYGEYSLDTDFFLFRPSIGNAQVFRVGLAWRY